MFPKGLLLKDVPHETKIQFEIPIRPVVIDRVWHTRNLFYVKSTLAATQSELHIHIFSTKKSNKKLSARLWHFWAGTMLIYGEPTSALECRGRQKRINILK